MADEARTGNCHGDRTRVYNIDIGCDVENFLNLSQLKDHTPHFPHYFGTTHNMKVPRSDETNVGELARNIFLFSFQVALLHSPRNAGSHG